MEKKPEVFLIFATDATQELARLLEILQNYKREDSIQDFSTLEFHINPTTLPKSPATDDLILVLLSNGLKSKIPELKNFLLVLKPKAKGVKLAVIKVDKIDWPNHFLTFPLGPSTLSNHPQSDEAWDQIHKDLGELLSFPAQEVPRTRKNLARVILILFIALLVLIGGWLVYDQYFSEEPPYRD